MSLKDYVRNAKGWLDRLLLEREASHLLALDLADAELPRLVRRFSTATLLAQAKRSGILGEVPKADQALSIIVFTQPPGAHRTTIVEATIAKLLVARGHQVKVVLCDKNQPGCDLIRTEHVKRKTQICKRCRGFGENLFKSLGLNVVWTSQIIAESKMDVGDVQIAQHRDAIESSLLRHWRTAQLPDDCELTPEWEMFSRSAAQSAITGQWIVDQKPDVVLMTHGIYVGREPAFKMLLRKSIPVLTHDRGRRSKTEHFHWNSPSSEWDLSEEWNRVKEIPLDQQQNQRLEQYLNQRKEHKSEVVKYSFGEIDTKESTLSKLKLDPRRRRYVLYPNLMWDANSVKRATIFESPTEWITHTINWFQGKSEFDLIIRIHPAEAVRGVTESVGSIIREHFAELPHNVRVIPAEERIASFNVQEITDVGLVYTSTVGMELALQGKPVAATGRVHYGASGFTAELSTREDYDLWLNDPIPGSQASKKSLQYARRYFHLWANRAQIPFEIFHELDGGKPAAWTSWDLSKLWSEPSLRLVVDCIEKRLPVYLPD